VKARHLLTVVVNFNLLPNVYEKKLTVAIFSNSYRHENIQRNKWNTCRNR